MKNRQGLRGARHWLSIQLLLTVIMMSIFYAWYGSVGAVSALMGGLTSAIPSACFAEILFRDSRASASKQFLRRVYRGEAVKIALSIVFFAAIFCFLKTMPWVFFFAYLIVQLTAWITPLVFITRECAK